MKKNFATTFPLKINDLSNGAEVFFACTCTLSVLLTLFKRQTLAKEKYVKYMQILSSQVFAVATQMCDMMNEIDKERIICEAQIENRTTGMSDASYVFTTSYLFCLILIH